MGKQTRIPAVTATVVLGLLAVVAVACSGGAAGGTPTQANVQSSDGSVGASSVTPSVGTAGPGGTPQGRPGGPPEAALLACAGKTEGASCPFVSPHGDAKEGICQAGPQGAVPLLCLPEGWQPGQAPGPGAPGGHAGPPEKALAACLDLTQGASCSFETPFGVVSGTCGIARDGKSLVCVPVGASPR